jgi:hypothetical protein
MGLLYFLHVSTSTRHPQGALIRCLLSYINVFIQSWWCFKRNFHIRFLKHKNCLSYNKLYFRNNSRKFSQVDIYIYIYITVDYLDD